MFSFLTMKNNAYFLKIVLASSLLLAGAALFASGGCRKAEEPAIFNKNQEVRKTDRITASERTIDKIEAMEKEGAATALLQTSGPESVIRDIEETEKVLPAEALP
jgi:hypothetical protein